MWFAFFVFWDGVDLMKSPSFWGLFCFCVSFFAFLTAAIALIGKIELYERFRNWVNK